MRLDRFLTHRPELSRQKARQLLLAGRVRVGGQSVQDGLHPVDQWSQIELQAADGSWQTLQAGAARCYLMLHKPKGCVSATQDAHHPTVMDWVEPAAALHLHLPGRLDFNTTGLLLLTNDGHWSRALSLPTSELPKTYLVTTRDPIAPETEAVFRAGIDFAYENLTTRPATLQVIHPHQAWLTIHEGRYHQVKRMFAAVGNKVVDLHRQAIGPVELDPNLQPGQWRALTPVEVELLKPTPVEDGVDTQAPLARV